MIKLWWDSYNLIIDIFQGFIATFFSWYCLGSKSGKGYIQSYGLIFASIFAFIVEILNELMVFEHFYAVFYVAVIFVYSIIFLKGKIYQKVFSAAYPVLIMFVMSSITGNLAAIVFSSTLSEIFSEVSLKKATIMFLTQVMIVMLLIISMKFVKKSSILSKTEWILSSSVLLICIVLDIILVLISLESEILKHRIYISWCIFIVFIINIVILYFVITAAKKNNELMKSEEIKYRIENYNQYIANAEKEYLMIRKFRHDSVSLHNAVIDLLNEGKIEKAVCTLNNMTELINDRMVYIHTDNTTVNSVVNAKLSTAKSLGINVTCISVDSFDGIEDIDLCRLLSNMLENAISAASQTEKTDQSLHLSIVQRNNSYVFSVKNSIDKSVLLENPDLKTTKQNTENHGYGISIIKDIAIKYHGKCDFYEKENFFYCVVMLSA